MLAYFGREDCERKRARRRWTMKCRTQRKAIARAVVGLGWVVETRVRRVSWLGEVRPLADVEERSADVAEMAVAVVGVGMDVGSGEASRGK